MLRNGDFFNDNDNFLNVKRLLKDSEVKQLKANSLISP